MSTRLQTAALVFDMFVHGLRFAELAAVRNATREPSIPFSLFPMTFGDVLTKVVTEITLEPEDQVREILKLAFETANRHAAFTDEISNAEAARIFKDIRKDPSEILSLYAAGKGALRRF